MNVNDALSKLREYARCGLSTNCQDIKQADKWILIIRQELSKQSTDTKQTNKEIV